MAKKRANPVQETKPEPKKEVTRTAKATNFRLSYESHDDIEWAVETLKLSKNAVVDASVRMFVGILRREHAAGSTAPKKSAKNPK